MPNHEEIPTTDTAQIEQIIERLNQLRILLLELALFESLDELLDLRGVGGWNFFVIWHVRSNALILCQVRAVAKPRPHFFFFTTLYRNDTSRQNVQAFLKEIKTTFRENLHAPVERLLMLLNPKIKGWAMFHRTSASKKVFSNVDKRSPLTSKQRGTRTASCRPI